MSRSDLKNARVRGQTCTPSVGRFKVTRVTLSRESSSAVERFERSTRKERTRDGTKGDSVRGAILIGKRRITTDFEVRRSVRKPSDSTQSTKGETLVKRSMLGVPWHTAKAHSYEA